MRTCKRYNELVKMYHFNPISECTLFENMETQHFYSCDDIEKRKEGICKYIYWYATDYEVFKNKKENEEFRRVELKRSYSLPIDNGSCNIPEGVTSIGNECFKYYKSLTSVQFSSSVISIGDKAFFNTKILKVKISHCTKYEKSSFPSKCRIKKYLNSNGCVIN